MPIPAGGYVGLAVPGSTVPAFQSSPGGQAGYSRTEAPTSGITNVVGESHNGVIMYDADIEPDVDGDGYGDVTQDSCPTSTSIHEGPCPAVTSGDGHSAPGPVVTPPRIGSLAVRPKSFHAKPLGRVPAKGKWGTKVKLSLSSPATVTFAIEARHGRHFHVVTRLTKHFPAGRASFAFSGQYRHAGKLSDLPPGPYRLTATPKSSAGTGPDKRAAFTILPPG
jgi:hypothetical protein